jgi:hypothetical protein
MYTKEIQTVTNNVTVNVPGPTQYINVTKNITVEKEVIKEVPTESTIFGIKLSWIAVIEGIVLGAVIIFLINWRKR